MTSAVEQDVIPLRAMRLGVEQRLRVGLVIVGGPAYGLLLLALATDPGWSWWSRIGWCLAGLLAFALALSAVLPLMFPRPRGQVRIDAEGVHVRHEVFVSGDLSLRWEKIDRMTTTARGDGSVFDGRLAAPTLVLIFRKPAPRLPIRLRWTVLAAVCGVRSQDRWPLPSRFIATERVGFNLDVSVQEAADLADRWDRDLPRHLSAQGQARRLRRR